MNEVTTIETREDLARHFCTLGFTVGAEVGVLGGKYSAVLCETIPDLTLYCVDSWGLGERAQLHDYHLRKYELAKKNLAAYHATLIRKTSMDAVKGFEDESLDFVYIDANHLLDAITDDIREWTKKVRKGGIVAGHDYNLVHVDRSMSVTEAVDMYTQTHGLDLHLTTEGKERVSWWFVKK